MAAIAANVGTPSRTVFVTPLWVADKLPHFIIAQARRG